MCGRYTLIRLADFTDMFPWIRPPETRDGASLPARYNIAPTQPIPVVPNDGKNQIEFVHWGLIPSWAKDPSIGSRMINARAESLPDKPAFRAALKRRRCLIPASGFYEWKKDPDGNAKTPMYIRMADEKPFAFAGLWETWHGDEGSELRSCTIITTEPNELVRPIHNRMPVILDPQTYQRWLAPGEHPAAELMPMLQTFPAKLMHAYPISRAVNNPSNDSPQCIAPADPPAPTKPKATARSRAKPNTGNAGDDQPGLFG
jgi:putative SOS response-associated peptidase YedK